MVLLLLILIYGAALRAWDLGSRPLTVDEAESCINALTILQHGLPLDHYLGLPIYENSLQQPWPESHEYEFKDSSYSERGLAVYHGWLPLYFTAASFALCGIPPDDTAALHVRHSRAAMHWRTMSGRLPAVLMGIVFLLVVFCAARQLYGLDAAWAALSAAVVCEPAIYFARQARYYSATMALTAGCCLIIVCMCKQGRWRDFMLGAIVFVLLFHTHVVSFVAAGLVFGVTIAVSTRRPGAVRKLAAFAGIVAVGTLPWILLTGFAESVLVIPKAHALLSWHDLLAFFGMLGPIAPLAGLALTGLVLARVLHHRLPPRLVRPFVDHDKAFLFLAGWAVLGGLTFAACVPAVSYFHGRLVLTIFVPGMLFAAALCAALARTISARLSSCVASGLFVLLLVLSGQASFLPQTGAASAASVFEVTEHLRNREIRPGTRLYATPNDHLILTFYTGIPIQSVAPVRKSFLDQYEGEILIVEAGPRHEPISGAEIQRHLSSAGHHVSDAQAGELESLLATRLLRADLQGRVAKVTPQLEPAPAYLASLISLQRRKTAEAITRRLEMEGNPMFKGFALPDHNSWWQIYYYRFVNPGARTGEDLNYATRIHYAHVLVLPGEWVVYHCPRRHPTIGSVR